MAWQPCRSTAACRTNLFCRRACLSRSHRARTPRRRAAEIGDTPRDRSLGSLTDRSLDYYLIRTA
uniref:Uncharacterized protein n=1 Tax=Setaria italica TaxID=4555 RepID=K3YXG8_SETIT